MHNRQPAADRFAALAAVLPVFLLPIFAAAQTSTAPGGDANKLVKAVVTAPGLDLPKDRRISAYQVPPGESPIRYVGRFDRRDANSYRFAWSGCQIQFRFTGRFAAVLLEDFASGGPSKVRGSNDNYFNVIVDDKPPVVLDLRKGLASYVLVWHAPPAREHTVTLFRRTEPLFNEVRFGGVELDSAGKLLPAAPAPKRLIEMVLKQHAAAHVFCCVGPMMQDDFPKDSPGLPTIRAWLTEMVADYAKAGRKNIHYVEFAHRRAEEGVGSNYHPSVQTHQTMAGKLTEAIKKEMGW